jgi:outer membrane receptor protein involved in Fe transport
VRPQTLIAVTDVEASARWYQQLFLQDTWKVNRKLTLDYGLRWDLATQNHEQYGRLGILDPTTPNSNAGGHPGATLYATTCKCGFYQPTYPYAIGPRIGVAYQLNPKTVFRGGWGGRAVRHDRPGRLSRRHPARHPPIR